MQEKKKQYQLSEHELKIIFTEDNYSRKECLLLPFETLRKGLKSNYGKI